MRGVWTKLSRMSRFWVHAPVFPATRPKLNQPGACPDPTRPGGS